MSKALLLNIFDTFLKQLDPNLERYHKMAEKMEPTLRKAFLQAIADVQGSIVLKKVEEALEKNDLVAAEEAIDWSKLDNQLGNLGVTLRNVFEEAARESFRQLSIEALPDTGMAHTFFIRNELAEAFVIETTGNLITQIGNETKQAIRDIILNAFQEGGHPYKTAREIKNLVGLTQRDARVVSNYRRKLEEMMVAGKSPFKTIKLTPQKVDELVDKYTKKKIKQRAIVIARHETLLAANKGQQAAWLQAAQEGIIPKTALRKWLTARDERVCPWCGPLHGKTVGLVDDWSITASGSESGKQLTYIERTPPLHVQCRCSMGLVLDGIGGEATEEYKEFTDIEANSYIEEAASEWRNTLQDHERQELTNYAATGFWETNALLRKTKGNYYQGEMAIINQIDNIKSGITHSLQDNITVYRGIREDIFGDKVIGAIINEHGFMSTTLSPDVFEGYAYRLHVKVPKNTNVAFPSYSYPKRGKRGEREVLFGPGSKLKITDIKTTGDQTMVYADLINDTIKKFNSAHDNKGRFASKSSGGIDYTVEKMPKLHSKEKISIEDDIKSWPSKSAAYFGGKGVALSDGNGVVIRGSDGKVKSIASFSIRTDKNISLDYLSSGEKGYGSKAMYEVALVAQKKGSGIHVTSGSKEADRFYKKIGMTKEVTSWGDIKFKFNKDGVNNFVNKMEVIEKSIKNIQFFEQLKELEPQDGVFTKLNKWI